MSIKISLFLRLIVLLLGASILGSCAPTQKDVVAFSKEEDGADKLAAVLANAKASDAARRDAFVALTGFKRRGRRVGLEHLLGALEHLDAPARAHVIQLAEPALFASLAARRLEKAPDSTLPAKDALVGMLARGLVADGAEKDAIVAALVAWAQESTLARLQDRTQRYGGYTTMRVLGARGAALLPPVLASADSDVDVRSIGEWVVAFGDEPTKTAAKNALIARYHALTSPEATEKLRHEIESADLAATIKPTENQLQKQLEVYRRSKLATVLDGLARTGGAVDFLLDVAADETANVDTRAVALASFKDREAELATPARLARLFALVRQKDAPVALLDEAFARALVLVQKYPSADLERERSELEKSTWQARFVGKSLALATLDANHVDEFMHALPTHAPIGLAEVYGYASALVARFGRERFRAYLADQSLGAHLVALTIFADDPKALAPFETESTPLPRCETCNWRSGIIVLDADDEVKTVGAFVTDCLERKRAKRPELAPLKGSLEEMMKALGGTR